MGVCRAARFCHACAWGGQVCIPSPMAQELVKQWTGMALSLESAAPAGLLHANALTVRPRVTHESHSAFSTLGPAVQRNLLEAAALPSLAPDLLTRRVRASRATREIPAAVPTRVLSEDGTARGNTSVESKVGSGHATPERPLSGEAARAGEVRDCVPLHVWLVGRGLPGSWKLCRLLPSPTSASCQLAAASLQPLCNLEPDLREAYHCMRSQRWALHIISQA